MFIELIKLVGLGCQAPLFLRKIECGSDTESVRQKSHLHFRIVGDSQQQVQIAAILFAPLDLPASRILVGDNRS